MGSSIQSELWVGVEIDAVNNAHLRKFLGECDDFDEEIPRDELIEMTIDLLGCQPDGLDYSLCFDGEEGDEKIIGFIIPKTTCELYVKPLDLVQIQSYSESKKDYLLKTFGVEPKIYLVPQYL